MIIEYKNSLIIPANNNPIQIHDGFKDAMDLLCKLLALADCKLLETSSLRCTTIVPGAIVKPATHGNHLIGHAIDANIIDNEGVHWDSKMLETFAPESPNFNTAVWEKNDGIESVYQFIKSVRQSGILRWGGDFHEPDTVHFDDGLNVNNEARWQQIYNELHK